MKLSELYFLIYRSQETQAPTLEELCHLVKQSQTKNKVNGITGLLIKLDSGYLQYIEGTKKDIVMLYERLLQDHRHYNLKLLKTGYLKKRRFRKWSMKFQYVSNAQIAAIEVQKRRNLNFKLKLRGDASPELSLALTLIERFEHAN